MITSTDSTSRPSSQTARTNRSTSTAVFPVPAPGGDEDLAARVDRCELLLVHHVCATRHIVQRSHHDGHSPPWVVRDIAAADSLAGRPPAVPCRLAGPSGSVAEFEVPERFQSWAGMVHGGVVALMLDEAVGWAAWHAGHPGVTGRLQVSYRRPLKLGESVRVVGKVERVRRTLVYCNAFIESQVDGGRIADASATLVMTETTVEISAQ